jgi:hemerythrin superfamily protein
MSTDALILLKQDHKELRRLFRALRDAGCADHADHERRGELVGRILRALMAHTFVEEEFVYPKVRQLAPDLDAELLRCLEEHHVADLLAGELAALHPQDERFEAKTLVLIDVVTRHIREKESGWMSQVRAVVSRKELQDLGADLVQAREQAPEPGPGSRLERAASVLFGA